ncbi:MAG: DUF3142 domain-containing protein [Magnetococcales bacterium]|nr:DUF3142 domain-containing protein [Magnetococcales bacterium]
MPNVLMTCRRQVGGWVFILLLPFTLVTDAARYHPISPLPLPPVMIWAWDRPEDLDFINPAQVGVAFLATHILVDKRGIREQPRGNPLWVPTNTIRVAVVRLEVRPGTTLQESHLLATTEAILGIWRHPRLAAMQLDFEASLSQRPFYRALLNELRRQWPTEIPLSITALASWCMEQQWLEKLPVDEIVPMAYRMGSEATPLLRAWLAAGGQFRQPVCHQSLGLATDEPLSLPKAGRRIYLFAPQPWTPTLLHTMLSRITS